MTQLDIYLEKTIEQNAAHYYERAKHAKQKREGALKALEDTKRKLNTLLKEKEKVMQQLEQQEKKQLVQRTKEWYEKFHWFYSSEGFLCIGGRDATTNEIVVKKHAEKDDLVLHTDMAGSPFFIIKNGQHATEKTIEEAAQATASYSKAWKIGMPSLAVFYVKPEQVTKEAKSGEYMGKGAFMIYGQTKYLHPLLGITIGKTAEGRVIGGPLSAVKATAEKYLTLTVGREKSSDVAKRIAKHLGIADVNEIIAFIPPGGCEIVREK